ncbi:MAG: hypothetical protein AABY64_10975 [Bdellovibrionota bacterium]
MRPKLNLKISKRGFTLVSLVTSLGVVTVIGLTLAAFSASSSSFFSSMDQIGRINNSLEEIRNTLADDIQCKQNFAGMDFKGGDATGTQINKLSLFDKDLKSHEILLLDQHSRGITTKDMRLIPGPQLTADVNAASLKLTFLKASSADGSQEIVRTIPIFVSVKANKVTNCWVKKSLATVVYNQICDAISGHTMSTFDPVTKKCTAANAQWFTGTSSSASCPKGASVPSKSVAKNSCGMSIPTAWVDPQPLISVTFADGSIGSTKRSQALVALDVTSNRCSCVWATNISDADIATFRCQILCVVP